MILQRATKRLYDWTLAIAKRPHAVWGLFILAFLESSIFPIPPDVILIALTVAQPILWKRYAGVTTVGSILGGIFGYLIGRVFFDTVGINIINFYHLQQVMSDIGIRYNAYGFLTVFTAAFTPIPYKVITISAGFFRVNFTAFLTASIVGRGLRFFLIGVLLYRYGERIRLFIDRYFNALSIAFVLLLVLGFIVLRYVL